MKHIPVDQSVQCIQLHEVWQLTRQGRVLVIIERAWDDHHWHLFLPDAAGEPAFSSVHRRIAALKVCLRLWARRLPALAHCEG